MGLNTLIAFFNGHATKALGVIGAVIPGMLGIDGLIQPVHTKYWLAAGVIVGALTVGRGFQNSAK